MSRDAPEPGREPRGRSPLTFRQRAGVGFAAAALLVLVVILVALFALQSSVRFQHAELEHDREMIELTYLKGAFEKKVASSRAYILTRQPRFVGGLAAARGEFLAALDRLRAFSERPAEIRDVEEIARAEAEHQTALDRVIALARQGAPLEEIADRYEGSMVAPRERMDRALATFLAQKRGSREALRRDGDRRARRLTFLLLASGAAAFFLTVALAFLSSRRLARLYELEQEERARAEEALVALQEIETRQGAIVNAALDGIVTIDEKGRIIEFNPAAHRIFGYRPEEAIGKEMAQLLMPAAMRDGHRRGMARYLESGEAPILGKRLEMPALRADGTEFPAELTVVRVPGKGPPTFTGFLRDISERKRAEQTLRESEERFRSMADAAPVLLWVSGLDGGRTFFNQSWLEFTGRPMGEQLGDGWAASVHPDDLARSLEVSRSSFRARRSFKMEFRLRRADGEYRWILDTGVPRVSGEGEFAGYIGSCVDVTDMRRAAEERAVLLAEARSGIRARDEFLSVASHELKTPVATLQLQIQGLLRHVEASKEGADAEKVAARLATAGRQLARLTELIDRLLDISRITAGRQRLELEEVDLSALVREAVARLGDDIERAGCRVSIEGASSSRGLWDRIRVEQVVLNLLSNAVKYGPGKPIEVTIDGDAGAAQLSIRDHGIGIAPQHQARIFDRFERAVSERHYGGLGLGLWIVRQNVEALGGSIGVTSEPENGSTFVVTLPRHPAPAS
jgi:PAS domain S-box-containing protein